MTAQYQVQQTAPTLEDASDSARPLLEAAQSALGFVPEMYRHMAKAPGVLSTYLHGYEQLRKNSGLKASEQEVIFLTISRENGCDYCMAAHSMLADKVSGVPKDVLQALREGKEIPDPRLAALSRFTKLMLHSRGKPSENEVKAFLSAGFKERDILQIILALAVKTLSNYSNHINQPGLDEAFASHQWSP